MRGKDQSQRTGPETIDKCAGVGWEGRNDLVKLVWGGDEHRERLLGFATLDGEDAMNGALVAKVDAEPVDGFGGENEQATGLNTGGGLRDAFRAMGDDRGRHYG